MCRKALRFWALPIEPRAQGAARRAAFVLYPLHDRLDEPITLGGHRGEVNTLRQLASEGRLALRRSGPYRAEDSNEALWAEVRHPTDPDATESFDINKEDYAELLSIGVAPSN